MGSRLMAIGRRPIPRTCGAQASADSAVVSCVEAASATPLATLAGLSISCIDLGRRELSVVSGGGAAALTRDGRVWFPEAVGSISERVIRSDALPSGTRRARKFIQEQGREQGTSGIKSKQARLGLTHEPGCLKACALVKGHQPGQALELGDTPWPDLKVT